jgi:hypothetical protein
LTEQRGVALPHDRHCFVPQTALFDHDRINRRHEIDDGAVAEHATAVALGLKVIYLDEPKTKKRPARAVRAKSRSKSLKVALVTIASSCRRAARAMALSSTRLAAVARTL